MESQSKLDAFRRKLLADERSDGTVEKYLRDAAMFCAFLHDAPLTKEAVVAWKAQLLQSGRAVSTVNCMLAAVNQFLRFLGQEQCRVQVVRQQRRIFRAEERELTRAEYVRLVSAAQSQGKRRLWLLLQAICATGVRVSEVRYFTVEAAHCGRAQVRLKGKDRTILLPKKLCRLLLQYAKGQKIVSGEIFRTRDGAPLSRKLIWAEMKRLCAVAGVAPEKVFPHNLRHLFAVSFYAASRDIVRLADVLGHSSVETTRIYLRTCGAEHVQQLEQLKLVC